jgi:hypothetical protein
MAGALDGRIKRDAGWASRQNDDSVRDAKRLPYFMRDRDYRPSLLLLQGSEEIHQLGLCYGILRLKGLVHEKQG